MPSPRYVVPSDVVLALCVSLSKVFDGLRLAALAIGESDTEATLTTLRYMHVNLDAIHESLLAVVTESDGGEDGSPRPC